MSSCDDDRDYDDDSNSSDTEDKRARKRKTHRTSAGIRKTVAPKKKKAHRKEHREQQFVKFAFCDMTADELLRLAKELSRKERN